MKKDLERLEKAHGNYIGIQGALEAKIADKVDFDEFSIFYQQSDGFVLEYDANNAPLDACIEVIIKKGHLSIDDYMDLRI